ncbi:hypothetical protein [Aurantiacibacter luteus]|uniref:Spore coat protein U domain-containing protein n=1 Tax=Aurantiacibacter luteus TaxID=1581420 RepID=A0A0G9MP10_9SPHN|nr:hypothetical protein [Aurantiacibacter luteus]KLE32329.1 hypothetical protein AAW00_12755 [Aurantiacibacter luteus]
MRLLFGLMIGAFIASPAAADEIENARTVQIAVDGTISQRCAMGNVPNIDFGELNRGGQTMRARVALDCNVPFTMKISGSTGALTHTSMPLGQGPYSGALPYALGIAMAVRHPSLETVNRVFDSRSLRGGGSFSSNGGIATDGMTLSIELGTPSGEAGLLAGHYAETITITVSPM